jgi:hypothetical protein
MDSDGNGVGSDQFTDPMKNENIVDYEEKKSNAGFYEDVLMYDQKRIPAQLICNRRDPYIQDDISKSQRHNPIRTATVRGRTRGALENRCRPPQFGKLCPDSMNQRGVYVPEGQDCPDNAPAGCSKPASDGSLASEISSEIKDALSMVGLPGDNRTLLLLFIFIVVVFIAIQLFRSHSNQSEKNETIATMSTAASEYGNMNTMNMDTMSSRQ